MTQYLIPQFQRALVEDAAGQPVFVHDAPVPRLRPRTLLVKTTAVAINPSDYKIGANCPTPRAILGMDFVGKILQMDAEAVELRPDLAVGDKVCGFVHGSNPADPNNGSFAEYLRAHAQLVYRVPEDMKDGAAATMGVSTATAVLALWHALKLPASPEAPLTPNVFAPNYVLVYGASTASGTMILQLLKLSGFTTIATCSPKNFSLVKSYGADHVFDYADENTSERIRQVTGKRLEYVVDCITDKFSLACCYAAMARFGGRYVTLEMCSEDMKPRRRAVKQEFVLALDIFGERVELNRGYEREASPDLHEFAVKWYHIIQSLIRDVLSMGFGC
ncbi:hypothetical protein N0V93_000001 [Gnomoniopsis smithogilvyi]|uniref:Enoyl reductase (ER) domain-containing protein n=1 Tax=Gnomoniopsis smithogilvyi TaxID=1191159 RepID=A0A9W8Z354_9PEZI|nr:hypothetical protein N0V93_000001 [Gnomoniopsis smithogilvyi]